MLRTSFSHIPNIDGLPGCLILFHPASSRDGSAHSTALLPRSDKATVNVREHLHKMTVCKPPLTRYALSDRQPVPRRLAQQSGEMPRRFDREP